MKVGCAFLYAITKYGFPPSFESYLTSLRETKEAGFSAVEMEVDIELNLIEYLDRQSELVKTLKHMDLKVTGLIGVVQDAFSVETDRVRRAQEGFQRLAGLSSAVGCPTLVICAYMPREFELVKGTEVYEGSPPVKVIVPPSFDWESFWKNAVRRLRELCDIAADHGLNLAIENRVGDFVNTSDGVLNLVRQTECSNAGIVLDVAHTHATKEFLPLVISKLKNRILAVHMADNDSTTSSHLPPGQGTIDFPQVIENLQAIGYQGYINVDIGGLSPNEIWEATKKAREYFERCLAR